MSVPAPKKAFISSPLGSIVLLGSVGLIINPSSSILPSVLTSLVGSFGLLFGANSSRFKSNPVLSGVGIFSSKNGLSPTGTSGRGGGGVGFMDISGKRPNIRPPSAV